MNNVPRRRWPVRLGGLLCLLCGGFAPVKGHETHQPAHASAPAQEMPTSRLQYITHTPPSRWELQGVVSPRDLARLLLRHRLSLEAREPLLAVASGGTGDYTDQTVQDLNGPDLLKAELSASGGIRLAPPAGITVMEGYGYILPLLISNHRSSMLTVLVETPWRNFEFPLPAESARGFCLNLPRFYDPGPQRGQVTLSTGEDRASADFDVDVRPAGRLSVRLQDGEDEPAAARVYLTGADGLAHMPDGGLQRIARETGEYFFYSGDRFEVALPAGPATIEAVRGIEYAPVQETVQIPAGETLELTLTLDHRFRLRERSWYSGDAHIHANYINNELIGVDDIHLQVSAEGLDVANLMVANSGSAILHDERFFEGRPHAVSRGPRILYWNEEMRNRRLYGHMSFFNLKDLVYPLYTGFPGTPHWEDYPPNFNQAEKARAQDGAVTYVHPAIGTTLAGVGFGGAREFPVDLILGEVDALDVLSNTQEMPATELWYRVLNTGVRCALSAGSDSFTNFMMHWVPGGGRVYVQVPGEFSYQGWIDNYRAGRSFVTNGPIVTLSVHGRGPGEELNLSGVRRITVRAEVSSIVPVDRLEIVLNGSVVASRSVPDGSPLRIEQDLTIEDSGWVAARALGPAHRLVMNDAQAFAHTGPVFLSVKDRPIRSPRDARFWITWIEDLIADLKDRGAFASTERRDSVIALFRKAQQAWAELAR